MSVERLGIASIQTSTPQAKERMEWPNLMLQDRLAKKMRRAQHIFDGGRKSLHGALHSLLERTVRGAAKG